MHRPSHRRLDSARRTANAGAQVLIGAAIDAVFVLARTWGRIAHPS